MATKAFERFKAALEGRQMFFYTNHKRLPDLKVAVWCSQCAGSVADEVKAKGKKLTARQVWNYNFKCDTCNWHGGR